MQRYVCARCALKQKRSTASVATLSLSSQATFRRNGRSFHNGKKAAAVQENSPVSQLSVDEILLKTEFEEKGNIREYLRKWREKQPSSLDPVRELDLSGRSMPWVGNMLSDSREAHDNDSDMLSITDEATTEYSRDSEEGGDMQIYLEPGDLVGLAAPSGTILTAIYVRSIQKQQQFYTERGKWRVAFTKDLDYVIKGFAPRELVAPLLPYFPDSLATLSSEMQSAIEGGVPRPVAAPLVKLMADFDEDVRTIYRNNTDRLDNIHDYVADDEKSLEFNLRELAAKALKINEADVNEATLFAVHKAIKRHPFIIDYDRNSPFTDYYLIRPKRMAKNIEMVGQWVREHQEHQLGVSMHKEAGNIKDHPLHKFLQKAQRLIRLSRKIRSPTTMSSVGPTAQRFSPDETDNGMVYREISTESFSESDRIIIEYLQLYAIPPRRMISGIMRSAGSYIMRATGMYSTLGLSAASMPLFLQELGVFSPWENLHVLDQSLSLPGHGLSRRSEQLVDSVKQACEEIKANGLKDSMEGMRTDFGDLPVYCVDDAGAEEIDDGVSLERVAGSEDTFWIRIHVANPSAFIPPDHIITKYASSRYQSLYVPERTYPMLPKSVTQDYFSLAPGRPTLTFSAKMNTNGDILDTNVTSGYIRNVINITHDDLRKLFNDDVQRSWENLTVGGEFPKHSRQELRQTMSQEDKTTFHALRQLMLAFREQRLKRGAIDWPAPVETAVSVFAGNKPMPPHKLSVEEGRYFLGDPVIQMQYRRFDPYEVADLTKRNLISTLMNLGCWIAGRWLADRNIPAVFDGTWYHPEYPKLTRENIFEYGGTKWLDLGAPKGVSSSSVIPHVPLGLDAYVKTTSPLRRYVDLLAHYQIEAALRYENAHGTPLNFQEHASVVPFQKLEVDKYIERASWQRIRLKQCSMSSEQFWACLFLFRAFYFNECVLPETHHCLLHNSYSNTALAGSSVGEGYAGLLLPFGVRCQVVLPPSMTDVDIMSEVEARIVSVDMSRNMVLLEAVRLVKHYERVGEWA
ncbi:3'-5' RNA exonuclease complex component [Paecilomyces lecythidis]